MFCKKSLVFSFGIFLAIFFQSALKSEHIVYLVPSTGVSHMEKHSESKDYFKEMWNCAKACGMRLEVFKDWHQPAIIKDFVHRRLEQALEKYKKQCSDFGREEDKSYVDQVCRAKMLLHAAVPDLVNSNTEAGWKPDHRILAAQTLAVMVLEQNRMGNTVSIVGLGIGGGQIATGATRLLASGPQSRGFERPLAEFARVLDGVAPFFGPVTGILKWGAQGVEYISRAVEILKNNSFLWQAARLPVSFIKEVMLTPGESPCIEKLFTVGTPVARDDYVPNLQYVSRYYNIYSKLDLRCRFLGMKMSGLSHSDASRFANLSINFIDDLIPVPGHAKLMDSTVLARWMLFIDERLQNSKDFQFGVDGKIIFFKDRAPFYKVSKTVAKSQVSPGHEDVDFQSPTIDSSEPSVTNFIGQVSTDCLATELDPCDLQDCYNYQEADLTVSNHHELEFAIQQAEIQEDKIVQAIQDNQNSQEALCRGMKYDEQDSDQDQDCEVVSKKTRNREVPTSSQIGQQDVVLYQCNDFAIRASPMAKVVLDFVLTMVKMGAWL